MSNDERSLCIPLVVRGKIGKGKVTAKTTRAVSSAGRIPSVNLP